MTALPEISGEISPRFSGVKTAFANALAEGGGGGFAVYQAGEPVLDLWGGLRDRKNTQAWQADTLPCVFSVGKAIVAAQIAEAVSAGRLSYDDPVARHWPAFAAAGKEAITLDHVLSHQGGLPGFPDEMDPALWTDWDAICTRLAAMTPLWPPGTANGYHPQTFGFLAGELLHRTTGHTVGQTLRERTSDVICGLQDPDFGRLAEMVKPPHPPDLGEITPETEIAFLKPWSSAGSVPSRARQRAEIPASNMYATARGLADAVHFLANGGVGPGGHAIADPAVIPQFLAERCHRPDRVLPFTLSWAGGVMRNTLGHYGPNANAVGHYGFGGAVIVIDTDHRLSLAFVTNAMSPHLVGDPRAIGLIEAVYRALG